MTELDTTTTPGGTGLVLATDQERWNDRQLAALQQLGVKNAGPGDLAVFLHVSQRTGLDPFARQIYMIERQGKQTIQTGIDGFRLVARRAVDRAGETLSIEAAEWRDREVDWTDAWMEDRPPAAARMTVVRAGQRFTAVALLGEYLQTNRDGKPMALWATRPAGMLAKCAEALALRKAFPQDLAAVYTDDEMSGAGAAGPRAQGGLSGALRNQRGAREESPLLDMTGDLAKRMFATLNDAGITQRDRRLEFVSDVLGRDFTTTSDMTDAEAQTVIAAAHELIVSPPADQPADEITDAELVPEEGS